MNDELKALAERVEALAGPCRETDARIWCAVNTEGYNRPQMHATTGDWFCMLDAEEGRPLDFQLPDRFTASLDAAMTLVPDGWVIASLEWWPITKRASVALREVSDNEWGIGYDENSGDARAQSTTPALALTAAAIRAMGAP